MEEERGCIKVCRNKEDIGGIMMLKLVAEISISKLEDRKTVTAILHENGYTVGPGRRHKTPTGKSIEYYLKIYEEDNDDKI